MEFSFDRNTITITQLFEDFTKGDLFVDLSYQRRSVWLQQDRVRLIETILLGYVVPEIFFWVAYVDPATGKTKTHIVDGQQRINAIIDFITGVYVLSPKFLLNSEMQRIYGNMSFADLPDGAKRNIWQYRLSVVHIDSKCSIEDILNMFRRLNLTEYSLNSQEKRRGYDNQFNIQAETLAEHDFWKAVKVFSARDARRMRDTTFCCSLYILAFEGIIDETTDKKINEYFDAFADEFDSELELQNKIFAAMTMIAELVDKKTISFLSKKAQLYTVFSVVFRLIDEHKTIDGILFERFALFTGIYNSFSVVLGLEKKDESDQLVFDMINKYRLASSEGVNKLSNRTIRYEMLYKLCTNEDKLIIDGLHNLYRAVIENERLEIKKEAVDAGLDLENDLE